MIYYPDTMFEKLLTYFMGVFSTYIGIKGGSSLPQQVENKKEDKPVEPFTV
jgi:hypothetical protein